MTGRGLKLGLRLCAGGFIAFAFLLTFLSQNAMTYADGLSATLLAIACYPLAVACLFIAATIRTR